MTTRTVTGAESKRGVPAQIHRDVFTIGGSRPGGGEVVHAGGSAYVRKPPPELVGIPVAELPFG